MLNISCVVNTLIDVSPYFVSFQMLLNIFMKIPLETGNVGIFSTFPSDVIWFLSYNYHDKLLFSKCHTTYIR